jgi:hypothetical protein
MHGKSPHPVTHLDCYHRLSFSGNQGRLWIIYFSIKVNCQL